MRSSRWPGWPLSSLAFFFCFFLGTAEAQQTVELGRVTATIDAPWPMYLGAGLAPVVVTLRNTADRSLDATVSVDSNSRYGFTSQVQRTLEPGAVEQVVLPILSARWNAWTGVTLTADGERQHASVQGDGYSAEDEETLQVLFVARTSPPAGAAESWSTRLSAQAEVTSLLQERHQGRATGRMALAIHPVERSQLPRRADFYSSLHVVMIDAGLEPDPAQDWQGVLAWVRGGGRLLVVGKGAEKWLRSQPRVAEWMESRLAWPVQPEQGRLYRHGLGVVGWVEGESPAEDAVQRTLIGLAATVPDPGPELRTWPVSLAGIRVPKRALTVALILFVILIWPVNFRYIQKRGKPVLLLITVPLIALASSLAMLAYGTFAQGLDIKCVSQSVTLLDQRTHHATSREYRELFAGLAPGHGLRPASGTLVLPRLDTQDWRSGTGRFHVDVTEGWELGGDYLPPRQRVDHFLVTDAAARQRLVVRRDGDRLRAQNGLGTALEGLVVRDPEGELFHTTEVLPDGGEATLESLGFVRLSGGSAAPSDGWLGQWPSPTGQSRDLPPGTYLARARRSVWSDATGLDLNHVEEESHVVLGVLPMDGEEWR